ncbi:MAG TPA: formylglycine-generating enzyme family protein [Pyrinomonadaceae bacterium]|jgi:formylglycine-generating enzyme required for sulfatase activity
MEKSHSQEETLREEKTGELAPLDEVDYKSLARLTAQISSPPQTAGGRQPAPYASAKKSTLPLILICAALIAIAFIGALAYLLISSKKPSPVDSQTESNVEKPVTQQEIPPGRFVKREMIAIPGGTFQMGRNDGPLQESPKHIVTVAAFYMDNTEVTNAEYADFVRETGHAPPSHFVNGKPLPGQEQWPVVNVSIKDAEDFAAWRSQREGVNYRLPTEEEWEYAARNGDQNNLYPWGNSVEQNRAAVKSANLQSVQPVGSYPEVKNRWGVLDLIGNAWEWTASKAYIYPGGKGGLPPEQKDWCIIRGGSIMSDLAGDKPISSSYRDWIPPKTTNPYLGFRLVRATLK